MWLSGLSASLRTKRSPVPFPVRADAWVAGQIPSEECVRGNHTLMFFFLCSSLSLWGWRGETSRDEIIG